MHLTIKVIVMYWFPRRVVHYRRAESTWHFYDRFVEVVLIIFLELFAKPRSTGSRVSLERLMGDYYLASVVHFLSAVTKHLPKRSYTKEVTLPTKI